MKVIHLISGGDSGGAKTHVLSLLQHLNQTITAQLVCFRDGPFAEEARQMGIPTMICGGNNVFRTRRKLAAYIREGGYEIIHCHGSRANMIGAMLRKVTGLPVVTTVHSDYRLDYMGRPLSHLTFGTINALALRRLDYRIGVSDAMVDLLISRGFDPDKLFAIAEYVDLFLFDIKHMDPKRHNELTGIGNELILSNLKELLTRRYNVKVRMPMLKGINDSKEEIDQVIQFLLPFRDDPNFKGVDLLPYHKMGVGKYGQLDKPYPIEGDPSLSQEDLDRIEGWMKAYDFPVTVVRH